MRKTANKRNKIQMPAGIRQKMMAAVSMLMVSCIMLVSSTYAWFTLSTAPEVSGITTNVGANGNLEMLLLTGTEGDGENGTTGSYYSGEPDLGVISEVGDSMANKSAVDANVKWGNLVDLSDESYGLSNISLAPARLNATKGATEGAKNTISTTLLKAPSYGADGRVIEVNTLTYTGSYNKATGANDYNDAHRGVRVIGTTTDVSQRLGAYRNANTSLNENISTAKSKTTQSLVDNGQTLADIMIGYAAGTKTTFNNDDLEVFGEVLNNLDGANEALFSAIKNAVLKETLSGSNTAEISDTEVGTISTAITAVAVGEGDGVDELIAKFNAIEKIKVPTGMSEAIAQYLDTKDKIDTAQGKITDLTSNSDKNGSYRYDDITPILNSIIDRNNVAIAGKKPFNSGDINIAIQFFTTNHYIDISMEANSGVYADIAKMIGDYIVEGLTVDVSYGDFDVKGASIVMQTKVSTEAQALINVMKAVIGAAPTDTVTAGSSRTLSNTYGYALDLGFRTNAPKSDLLLQTEAVNRVYTYESGETAPTATQGGGSYMQFASSNISTFSAEDVLKLMSAIRVAFVSAPDGEILAMGALDIVSTVDQDTGIYSVTPGSTVEAISETNNTGYKAGLFLYEYSISDVDGSITLENQLTPSGTVEAKIKALEQNIASKITVIVYLDGDIVDNTMVANADNSMTGVLNLQFSSNAALDPMENTHLRNDGGETGEVVEYNALATSNGSYTFQGATATVNDGYTIYEGSDGKIYYSNNGVSFTELTVNTYHYALDVELPEENTQNVTPENGTQNEPENGGGEQQNTDPEPTPEG